MGIHFIFIIIVGIPVRVYKNLKIIIVENNGVPLF